VDLPEGIVTFLFSDVEGSTQLLERHPHEMGDALARHYELFERAVARHGGVIFETVGDAVYAAFSEAESAIGAALAAQQALAAEDWGPIERIACRIAIHTGIVERRGDHYFGPALFRCARLQVIGYGEQTLMSAQTAEAVRDRLPDGAALRDLGRHRLKDLREPEHAFMLVHPDLRQDFPPPKSIDLHPNNLPLQLSSFVGRGDETAALNQLLDEHRLVTIVGSGGVGKTRLALQVAAQLVERMPDGVFLTDLAAVRNGVDVIPAVAETLGVSASSGTSISDVLGTWLAARDMLLVLDNMEQIQAAGAPVLGLLQLAPRLRLLVTSRRPLRLRGEQVLDLSPLDVDLQAGGGEPGAMPAGIQLFLDRAAGGGALRLEDADMAAIAQICRRLDGLPLAIELAAARMAVFAPRDLLARLERRLPVLTSGAEDSPARQQALRDTIAWSVDLLEPAQQAAFSRLAAFRGGWTLDAAEAICGVNADLLTGLVDASLVRRADTRYRMLETVREFAEERFVGSADREEVLNRHAAWFADWAQGLTGGVFGRHLETREEFQAVEPDRENLRTAMDRLMAEGDVPRARGLAVTLWYYWLTSGNARQADSWMGRLLGQSDDLPPAEAAWLHAFAAEFPRFAGETRRATEVKERGLLLARVAGDLASEAAILHDLSYIATSEGDLTRARRYAEMSLALRRKRGTPGGIAHALAAMSEVEVHAGNLQRAKGLVSEVMGLGGNTVDKADALVRLADIHRRLGETHEAALHMLQAISMAAGWNEAILREDLLLAAAALLVDLSNPEDAALVMGVRDTVQVESGLAMNDPKLHEDTMTRLRDALASEDLEDLLRRGRRSSADWALTHVTDLLQQRAPVGSQNAAQ
jgi:predicted ATPase/class 3 adenylate cyclase